MTTRSIHGYSNHGYPAPGDKRYTIAITANMLLPSDVVTKGKVIFNYAEDKGGKNTFRIYALSTIVAIKYTRTLSTTNSKIYELTIVKLDGRIVIAYVHEFEVFNIMRVDDTLNSEMDAIASARRSD